MHHDKLVFAHAVELGGYKLDVEVVVARIVPVLVPNAFVAPVRRRKLQTENKKTNKNGSALGDALRGSAISDKGKMRFGVVGRMRALGIVHHALLPHRARVLKKQRSKVEPCIRGTVALLPHK